MISETAIRLWLMDFREELDAYYAGVHNSLIAKDNLHK